VKERFLLLAVALLLAGEHRVHAAAGSFGVGAGLSLPTADLGRGVGKGPYFSISWSYPLSSHEQIGVDGNCTLLTKKTQSTQFVGFPVTGREKATIVEAVPYLRVLLAPRLRVVPYFKAGVGINYVKPDLTLATAYGSIRTTQSHIWAGELVGLGVATRVGKTRAVCVEGLFHQILSTDGLSDEFFTVAIMYWFGSGRRRQ